MPWHLLLLTAACGQSFETDGGVGGNTTATGATRASSAAPASGAASTTKAASSTVGTPTSGSGDPCVDGNYAACIAEDAPILSFSFEVIDDSGVVMNDTANVDSNVALQPDGMGTCNPKPFIGGGVSCLSGGYTLVGDDVGSMFDALFAGTHPHTVELWMGNPRVEMNYSQTLFLMYGQQIGDPPTVTGNSAFMSVGDDGQRYLTAQRRVYDSMGMLVLIGAAITLEDDYVDPAHVVVSYDGAGTLQVCRNGQCNSTQSAEDGPLDRNGWFVGYTRDVQAFTGDLDELAYYDHVLDDATRERHCRAGFAALGRPDTACLGR